MDPITLALVVDVALGIYEIYSAGKVIYDYNTSYNKYIDLHYAPEVAQNMAMNDIGPSIVGLIVPAPEKFAAIELKIAYPFVKEAYGNFCRDVLTPLNEQGVETSVNIQTTATATSDLQDLAEPFVSGDNLYKCHVEIDVMNGDNIANTYKAVPTESISNLAGKYGLTKDQLTGLDANSWMGANTSSDN